VKRWIDRWDAYWFPQASPLYLCMSRIIVVGAQLLFFLPSLEKHFDLLDKNPNFIDPQVIISAIAKFFPRDAYFTHANFIAIHWVMVVAGILALIGLFTRPAVFVFALLSGFFVAHEYSYGDRHHTEALWTIFIMCLAFSPSNVRLSVDALLRRRRERTTGAPPAPEMVDSAMWPLKFAHVLLSMTYFSTGASKLIAARGLMWMNGYTLQWYTFGDAMRRGFPFGVWLAQQHGLAVVMSVFTVLFELFFFVSLFVPRAAPLFFLTAIGFHIGLYFAAGHDFFQHIALNFTLLVCLTPWWWRDPLTKYLEHSRGREPARQPL
jgi:uncharacterized membrane protein YphA (DoxX/SURF4 family)